MTQPVAESGSAFTAGELQAFTALAKEQAKAMLQKIPLLGAITWLMMQQSGTRHILLSELEWRVMPALMLDQAKLYLRDEAPLAYVSWARLSEDVVTRYRTAPHQLTPADWKSGEQIWLVDVFTPFGGAQELLADIRKNVFPEQPIFQLAPSITGPAKIQRWEPFARSGSVSR